MDTTFSYTSGSAILKITLIVMRLLERRVNIVLSDHRNTASFKVSISFVASMLRTD